MANDKITLRLLLPSWRVAVTRISVSAIAVAVGARILSVPRAYMLAKTLSRWLVSGLSVAPKPTPERN